MADPAVAFDGTNYLVVYRTGDLDDLEIRGTRISQAGIVLDPGGFPIVADDTRSLSTPAVAFDGRSYLVTWQTSIPYAVNVNAARLRTDGTILGAPFVVDSGIVAASQAIAFGLGGLIGAVGVDWGRAVTGDDAAAFALVFGGEAALFVFAAALAIGAATRRAPMGNLELAELAR